MTMALILSDVAWLSLSSLLGSLIAGTAAIIAARRSATVEAKVDANTALTIQSKANVAELAKNIDGRMEELKSTIAEKNLAEGQLKGIAHEQGRTEGLLTEPQAVETALHDSDVRDQITAIEDAVTKKTGNGVGEE